MDQQFVLVLLKRNKLSSAFFCINTHPTKTSYPFLQKPLVLLQRYTLDFSGKIVSLFCSKKPLIHVLPFWQLRMFFIQECFFSFSIKKKHMISSVLVLYFVFQTCFYSCINSLNTNLPSLLPSSILLNISNIDHLSYPSLNLHLCLVITVFYDLCNPLFN
jgi:hypothetical protein